MSFAAGQADTRLQKGGRRSDLNSESEVSLKLAAGGCVRQPTLATEWESIFISKCQ